MAKTKTTKKTEGKQKAKRIILLDVHAILHRAYHALPDFATSSGQPTGALYGVCTMLIKIISDLKPDYIIACYDLPEKTYRHEAYADYKAGRGKSDDELISQIIKSNEIFDAFSIPIYSASGFEADDILGTIVKETEKDKDLEIIIASGDMDTLQLVDKKKVQVFTLKKGINDTILYDEQAVLDRYGFGPDLIPDYKGLRGDPSDNIIGIKGIGEKTATILLTKFGSLEDVYKVLKKDKQKILDAGLTPRIVGLLEDGQEDAEFSKMLATIRLDAPIKWKLPEKEFKADISLEKAEALFSEYEFRNLGDRLRSVLGFGETVGMFKKEEEVGTLEADIDPLELDQAKIALWLLNSDKTDPDLKDIYTFTKSKDFKNSFTILKNEVKKRGFQFLFDSVELPLIDILKRMRERGVLVDKKVFKNLSKKYHTELDKFEKKIYKIAGREFNIKSPKQLGEIIYDELGLKPARIKKTAGGQKSTAEKELLKMKDQSPIIDLILSFRELQKLLSTYIDNIPEMLDKESRLHARFVQTGTTTGRMSSQDPNLQNIPIRTELGRPIREAFVASKGMSLVALDYSQIELRIAAFLSEDKKMMKAFKDGEDIHTTVAAEVFGVKPTDVDKEMRRKSKVINFGVLYGMGVNALKANLGEGTDRKEAQLFYNTYFEKFSGLAKYMNDVKAEAERKGYTETIYGRRRYFEGLKSKLPFIRAAAERMAINAPIQGAEADLVKLAMIEIEKEIEKSFKGKAFGLMQIHDEMIYEVSDSEVKKFTKKAKEIMEGILTEKQTKGVPIIANISIGSDWGHLE
jgi:DNA polymerase I